MIDTPERLTQYAALLGDPAAKSKILVSMGTCGIAAGTTPVLDSLRAALETRGLANTIHLVEVGCMGLCHSEPTIELFNAETGQQTIFGNVTAEQAGAVLDAFNGEIKGLDTTSPGAGTTPRRRRTPRACPRRASPSAIPAASTPSGCRTTSPARAIRPWPRP